MDKKMEATIEGLGFGYLFGVPISRIIAFWLSIGFPVFWESTTCLQL